MEVKIVVMLRAILAGTAVGGMKKQHHDRTTRTIAGTKMEDIKLSVRRRNVNTALRLAKEPVFKKETYINHRNLLRGTSYDCLPVATHLQPLRFGTFRELVSGPEKQSMACRPNFVRRNLYSLTLHTYDQNVNNPAIF